MGSPDFFVLKVIKLKNWFEYLVRHNFRFERMSPEQGCKGIGPYKLGPVDR